MRDSKGRHFVIVRDVEDNVLAIPKKHVPRASQYCGMIATRAYGAVSLWAMKEEDVSVVLQAMQYIIKLEGNRK